MANDKDTNKINFSLSLSSVQRSDLEKQLDGVATIKKTRKGFCITINASYFSSETELNSFRGVLVGLKESYKKQAKAIHGNDVKSGLKLGGLSLAAGAVAGPILGTASLGAILTAGATLSAAIPVVGWVVVVQC